jgi:hypothetical protein
VTDGSPGLKPRAESSCPFGVENHPSKDPGGMPARGRLTPQRSETNAGKPFEPSPLCAFASLREFLFGPVARQAF